ncbi:PAS domain-containing protein [Paraconexibacter sp.]|uniref:PAS domain-containing protein n=1 Tax=Paraconexibacter sp. TaxID=2949640 RepID=UPI00356B3DD0
MGVVLSASSDLVPGTAEPFLVVDRGLCVGALSRSAERLLGVIEPDAVNRQVTDFLVPADVERSAQDNLHAILVSAAGGYAPIERTVVRPAGEFGVFLEARVGRCGPSPAALVVLSAID